MAKNANMFLWWGSGSVPCWKPMIVLAEKGLWDGCPNKMLVFSKQEHKSEEITKLNPRGQLPTFKDGDAVVNESGAICVYLEDNYTDSSNRLIPTDKKARAQVLQRMYETNNLQSTVIEKLVQYKMRTKKEDWNEDYLKEGTKKAKDELSRWNTIVGDQQYLCGENFTMADVLFYPYIAFLFRLGAKLPGLDNLKKYYERVSERQSIKDTWPPHWKEGPGPDSMSDL